MKFCSIVTDSDVVKEGTSEKILTTSVGDHKEGHFFLGHNAKVTEITMNHDASLLASGDSSGKYIVWDAVTQQCLQSITTKGIFFSYFI